MDNFGIRSLPYFVNHTELSMDNHGFLCTDVYGYSTNKCYYLTSAQEEVEKHGEYQGRRAIHYE